MAEVGSSGGALTFGPIVLSGLAISKESLLKLMDNYMEFMVGMFDQFSENVDTYSKAVVSQSQAEIDQADKQATSDLFAGLSQSIGSILPALIGVGAGFAATKGLSAEESGLNDEVTCLNNAQDEISAVQTANPTELDNIFADTGGPMSGAEAGQTPPARAGGANRNPINATEAREHLEQYNQNPHHMVREMSGLDPVTGKAHPPGSERQKLAVKKFKRSVAILKAENNASGVSAEAKAANNKLIKESSSHINERVKRNEQRIAAIQTRISTKRQTYNNVGMVVSGAVGIGMVTARGSYTKDVGEERAKLAFSQSASNQSQGSSQETSKTATEAGAHAQDLIRELKELQANNRPPA